MNGILLYFNIHHLHAYADNTFAVSHNSLCVYYMLLLM